jgi:hypothetical protein
MALIVGTEAGSQTEVAVKAKVRSEAMIKNFIEFFFKL